MGDPTTVYELLGSHKSEDMSKKTKAAEIHKKAFELYHQKKFADSKAMFEEVKTIMEEITGENDEPSRVHITRCNRYLKHPPSDDWDGVDRLTAKVFTVLK